MNDDRDTLPSDHLFGCLAYVAVISVLLALAAVIAFCLRTC